jgi:inositol phosphorylceramide mannosyltransferase catalytic subunit
MNTRIPKIIHLIWLGGEKPSKFDVLVEQIKKINFDYELIEWNDNNINFDLLRQDAFDMCENNGAKSDILRFEVLYKYGGIYMDYDFLQIKKFDDLLHENFFAGGCEKNDDEIWNSIVGATPENIICKKFLDDLNIESIIKYNDINGVMSKTGPYFLKKVITENNLRDEMTYYGGKYFFPFPAVQRAEVNALTQAQLEFAKSFIDESTYCIHLHTTSWQLW